MDVTSIKEINKALKYIKKNIKTLDYVIFNAGTYVKENSKNITVSNTKLMMDLNFTAVIKNKGT